MNRRLVIGLGSGRCGTNSLACLLNMQPNACITHEGFVPLPWIKSFTHFKFYFEYISNTYPNHLVGDVAFYHLNYVRRYTEYCDRVKFVCLKRNKEDTVNSLIRLSKKFGVNHYTSITSKHWSNEWTLTDDDSAKFRNCFPKFDTDRENAISMYYNMYFDEADKLAVEFSEIFRIYDTYELLNTKEKQEDLFQFLAIQPGITLPGIKFTKGEEVSDKWRKSI